MRRLFVLALLGALAACGTEKPFVDFPVTPMGYTVAKQPDIVRMQGHFNVCYAEKDAAEAQKLADETCQRYGLQAMRASSSRYQCRITTPHLTTYVCIDPKMRMPDGTYINPLNKLEVQAWQKLQGPAKKDGSVAPSPTATELGAPPPAPVPMVPPSPMP